MADTATPAVRLPLINKLLFASDHVGLQTISYARSSWLLYFLVPPVGVGLAKVPPVALPGVEIDARVLAGILLTVGRLVDAVDDPLIGWWSDRTQSRWGRRIPFILFSTPFYALFAALIWFLPTDQPSLWNAIYLVAVLELFFIASTMSSGPLEALIPELSDSPSDRMAIVGSIFIFAILGATIGLVASGRLVDLMGFQAMGLAVAIVGIVFRYISLASVWKFAPRRTPPATVPFWGGLASAMRNPQFVYFLPTYVMFSMAVGVLMAWMPFFASGLLGVSEEQQGTVTGLLFATVIGGTVVAGIVIWPMCNRFGKRRMYGLCLVGSGLLFPLLGLVGLISKEALMVQAFALGAVIGIPMAAVFLLPKAFTADIADYHAILTNQRREATFYATQNFFEKVALSFSPLLLSLVLLLGDNVANPLGIRLAGPMAGLMALSGFVVWQRYKLPDTVDREAIIAAGLFTGKP